MKKPRRKNLGRNGEIIDSVSFRGHQWASAMRVGGRWEMRSYFGNEKKNTPTRMTLGRDVEIIASVFFRQPPWASVDVRDVCGRRTGDGELLGERQKNALNGRNYGGMAKLFAPSASVEIRGRSRCVWTEDGICEIISKKTGDIKKSPNLV